MSSTKAVVFHHSILFMTSRPKHIGVSLKCQKNTYATIQINRVAKERIVDFCDARGLKIGKFIENLFMSHVSGTIIPKP